MSTKKNQGTSNNLPTTSLASEQAAAQFKLDSHIVSMMLDEPFYASVLRGVNFVRTTSIPTAGVLAKDGEITMWWNPRFLAALTREQVKGLLKHEAMHLALSHTTTRRLDPHIIHNYATDLAINSDIPEVELPEGGLIPGVPFPELTESQKANMTNEHIERYQRISQKIESFPKGEASEWYFARLLEDKQVSEDIQKGNEVQGKSLDQAIKDGDVSLDKDGNLVDKNGNPVTIMPGSMDVHDGWDESSDEDRELIKGKIKKALEDAVKECDSRGQWGSVGAAMRETIRQIVSNEVDWRSVLKKFVGSSRRGTRTTSWTRLNKKYAGKVQGVKRGYTSSIAVYIDQSGSVDTASLELAFANLRNLAKKTTFTTFHFDTEVDLDSETVWRRGKTPAASRTRCGGTNFNAVTKHANNNKHRFDGYIIITDGEASKPEPSHVQRGWMIIPNRELMFSPDRSDFVMKMKEGQQ